MNACGLSVSLDAPHPSFESFYRQYPRKVGRVAAHRVWVRVTRATPAVAIIAGLERQLEALRRRERQFIPHPATWLNQGRWQDEDLPDEALAALSPRMRRNVAAARQALHGHSS